MVKFILDPDADAYEIGLRHLRPLPKIALWLTTGISKKNHFNIHKQISDEDYRFFLQVSQDMDGDKGVLSEYSILKACQNSSTTRPVLICWFNGDFFPEISSRNEAWHWDIMATRNQAFACRFLSSLYGMSWLRASTNIQAAFCWYIAYHSFEYC